MKTCCIVVIGHVDHGKTTLVRALTGIDTDRLPEEKARGLSITPGFAHRTYASGTIDFVDAPGHADFVQAMIAGATGAGAALVVISMVEGIGAQTLEHLRIAGLLGLRRGVVAVTKSDELHPSQQAEALDTIRAALALTQFGDAPLMTCSAVTGDGLERLHAALETTLQTSDPAPAATNVFLPIDRVFSLPGRGTIVTGTLLGRDLTQETAVVLLPRNQEVSIRGLQSRGAERDRIQVAERMAANLRGVTTEDIAPGGVLSAKGSALPSTCFDVHLTLLPALAQGLKHMQDVRVLFGTSSAVAQLRLFGRTGLGSGQSGYAQLRFRKPVVGFAGQRAILRLLSPARTIGGAEVLDPCAQPTRSGNTDRLQVLKSARDGDADHVARALCREYGGTAALGDIARLSRLPPAQISPALGDGFVPLGADRVALHSRIDTAQNAVLLALAAYHSQYPLRAMAPRLTAQKVLRSPALFDHVETGLLASGQIRKADQRLALCTHDPVAQLTDAQQRAMEAIEEVVRQAGLAPPPPDTWAPHEETGDLLALLIDRGRLISLPNVALRQTIVFHVETLETAAQKLSSAFPAQQRFTTSQARIALATSRRVIVPVLEYYDRFGLTLRENAERRMVSLKPVSPEGSSG